jgi:hypothetical protein
MVFASLKKSHGTQVGCELKMASTEINVEKATIRGTFDNLLHVDALKEQIPIRISFEYSIEEDKNSLTFEKEDLEAVILDEQKYIQCEVESEKDVERGKKFVADIAQIIEKYSKTKMAILELTDSTFQLTLPIEYSVLLDRSEIKGLLSEDFVELTIGSLEFSVDEKYSISIEPAQIYDLPVRLSEIMDKFAYRYIPPSVVEEIIGNITSSVEPKVKRLRRDLNLGSVYSMRIQGKNYEKTFEICKRIIKSVPKNKRRKVARSIRAYNDTVLEYVYRDFNRMLEKYLPPSIRRRIRSQIKSQLSELGQKKLV